MESRFNDSVDIDSFLAQAVDEFIQMENLNARQETAVRELAEYLNLCLPLERLTVDNQMEFFKQYFYVCHIFLTDLTSPMVTYRAARRALRFGCFFYLHQSADDVERVLRSWEFCHYVQKVLSNPHSCTFVQGV
ncbi:hypothetical protein GCM10023189_43210 [Nibrella saemangeumensis]|uniref:Uncharacterized protein n=1 Tax=Nibrella saemangeumensis TaxID=1084526 RepID=A0ABP8NAS3_9BACT